MTKLESAAIIDSVGKDIANNVLEQLSPTTTGTPCPLDGMSYNHVELLLALSDMILTSASNHFLGHVLVNIFNAGKRFAELNLLDEMLRKTSDADDQHN